VAVASRLAILLALLSIALPNYCFSASADDDDSTGLVPADLGVVINTADPLSVSIGNYYVTKRHIPARNVARVRFDPTRDDLPIRDFTAIKAQVERQVAVNVQAYALTWARPYRVGCMSMTSAFALGVDPKYCASSCARTKLDSYFNAPSSRPYDDLHMRPAMAIAAGDFATAKKLIDRGVESDSTFPQGTAYFVATNDVARNVRATEYPQSALDSKDRIHVELVHGDGVKGRSDVLFYFIGASAVPDLDSNRFVPGAIADHLTSFGGMLTNSSQMSSLRWIEAGATGSYGTVVEPCAFPDKFPDVGVLVRRYLAGETLIEAYWKSVAMPGQGIFIGEPLAAPFRAREQSGPLRRAGNGP
jgi:uncharacterized protein (TIGR03790 family)